jgi:hypothetical protein
MAQNVFDVESNFLENEVSKHGKSIEYYSNKLNPIQYTTTSISGYNT